jgi:hypothetical protein
MCDFNNLDTEQKEQYHQLLTTTMNQMGGKGPFLQLLESIRKTKPHPLINKYKDFKTEHVTITWNKVIFQDKLSLLLDIRTQESKRGNFLPNKEDKPYKKVLNLVRTLGPINFEFKAAENTFTLSPFIIIDDQTTKLTPLFDAIFFCSVNTVKKILDYQAKN